jgi:polyvinyl alcohol dehydrogenase (cytochrome)
MMAVQGSFAAEDGASLYKERCAQCHDGGVPRAPTREALRNASADNIRFSLTRGSMVSQAAGLTDEQKEMLVAFLTSGGSQPGPAAVSASCPDAAAPWSASLSRPHWTGWGGSPEQQRFQDARNAGLAAADVPRLKLKWAFAFPGVTKVASQPAIVNGRLFVGSTGRKVYSLNASSGCTYWSFDTEFPVRTAISIGQAGKTAAAFFGDQGGYAYAVEAASGKLLWKTRVEDYPNSIITGSPTLFEHTLYVPVASNEDAFGADPRSQCCKFRGSLSALDAESGRVLWKSYTVPEEPQPVRKNSMGVQLWGPSGAGVWSSPTVDVKRHRIYVTTGNSHSDPTASTSDAFVAFDQQTGKLLWSHQATEHDAYNLACDLPPAYGVNCPEAKGPDHDFSSSAILVTLKNGHRLLLAGQKSGVLHAIDPDAEGKVVWDKTVGHGGRVGGIQWGSATDGNTIYVALSDVKIGPAAPNTPGAQPFLGTAVLLDSASGGGLFAFDVATGEERWHTPHPGCNGKPGCSPAQSGAVSAMPGIVFSGGIDGHLRAYASADGKIVWDFDSIRDYTGVNGETGRGGSLDGPGAVVVGGMVYASSGYAYIGWVPGNVLLAFSVDGK